MLGESRPKEVEIELHSYLKGRMYQTEVTASAKALRQVYAWGEEASVARVQMRGGH